MQKLSVITIFSSIKTDYTAGEILPASTHEPLASECLKVKDQSYQTQHIKSLRAIASTICQRARDYLYKFSINLTSNINYGRLGGSRL